MPLPTIKHPTFQVVIPSTKKKQTYRRFLIGEEKILLMAKESGDAQEIAKAVYQVINNCLVAGDSIDDLCTFDFDYVFLRLRAASVDNIMNFKIIDHEDDDLEHSFTINLDTISINIPNQLSSTISLGDSYKMKLRYPSIAHMEHLTEVVQSSSDDSVKIDFTNLLLAACIEKVYDDEEVYEADNIMELMAWIDTFPPEAYDGIKKFLDEMPELTHKVEYKNSKGEDKEVVLRGIHDFFTF